MPPKSRLHAELIRQHMSYTPAREAVYHALKRLGPCQATDITQALAGQYDSRTTYRTIKLFLKIGIAVSLGHKLIELNYPHTQHHHHFNCAQCGRRINFWDESIEKALEHLTAARGFTKANHQIELAGLCRACSETAQK